MTSHIVPAPRRRCAHHRIAKRFKVLALACALLPLAGCPMRNHAHADAETLAAAGSPLAWTVLGAQATHHLATSSMEAKDPAPGNQFVVLDVSVRNRDLDPQVLSEGKLIAMDESNLQTFDTPVTVLNDDYLSLRVLAPDQSIRGKIAYEVPEHLPGVLYWSPGNGHKRILLNVSSAPGAQRTLADAGDADHDTSIAPVVDTAPVAGAPARSAPKITRADTSPVDSAHVPLAASNDASSAVPAQSHAPRVSRPAVADDTPASPPTPPAAQSEREAIVTYGPVVSAPVSQPARVPSLAQAPMRQVASIDTPPSVLVRLPAHPRVAAAPAPDADQARRLRCAGLVSRDDPAEKPRSLDFFAQSCRDYALPVSWRPPPARKSLFARASELLARVVVKPRVMRVPAALACSTAASPADRLVCSDPDLAAMDRQLAQTVARASDHVDPAALQREQQRWRGHVRNACNTIGCLQLAYGRQIARVEALAPLQP